MATEGKPIHSRDSYHEKYVIDDDDTAGILWERTDYPRLRRTLSRVTLSERSPASAERLPGFLQTVGITVFVCFLLVTGHQYYDHNHFQVTALPLGKPSDSATIEPIARSESKGTVLVTGATGRTGALLYKELQKRGETVRAFVRDPNKAKQVLGCQACDESEGIYVGDVTDPENLQRAMADGSVTTLAVAVGASPYTTGNLLKAIEFDSVVSSARALGLNGNANKGNLRIVFCSSMGTNKTPAPKWGGDILFWKLNAETFLGTSGIPVTIVKPCGLAKDMAGKNSTLLVGHHGTITDGSLYHTLSREDLASVMAEAVDLSRQQRETNLRFDLCSRPGPPTTDLKKLIESARWEWDQPQL